MSVMELTIGDLYKIKKQCRWFPTDGATPYDLNDGIVLYLGVIKEDVFIFFYENKIIECCTGLKWHPEEFIMKL